MCVVLDAAVVLVGSGASTGAVWQQIVLAARFCCMIGWLQWLQMGGGAEAVGDVGA
jgi:hypothetical protein